MDRNVRTNRFLLLIVCSIFSGLSGCGRKEIPKDIVSVAEGSYQDAVTMVGNKAYAEALSLLDKALGEGGGLNPDLVSEAYVLRARCHAELGNLDKADADMIEAEKGAGDLAQLLLVQGIIAKKKGDSAAAETSFSKAKELDPNIKIPQ
jgi:tetratricopeptide (TPR) repeat protein